MIKKAIKIFFILLTLVLLMLFCLFRTEKGRRFTIDYILPSIVESGASLQITGVNSDITKIDTVLYKTSLGAELSFHECQLQRDFVFGRNSVFIDRFVLKSAKKESNLEGQIRNILPFLRILRFCIRDLSLNKGTLQLSDNVHTLNDLKYLTNTTGDHLYCRIDNKSVLNINMQWNGIKYTSGSVNLSDFSDASWKIDFEDPEEDVTAYKFYINHKLYKIVSDGIFKNFAKEISVNDAFISYKNINFNLCGKIFLQDKKSDFSTRCNLGVLASDAKIPDKIVEQVQNTTADVNIQSIWGKGHDVSIVFEKNGIKEGEGKVFLKDNQLKLYADVSWINFFGYYLQTITVTSNDLMHFSTNIQGKDFSLHSGVVKNQDLFEFTDLICNIPEGSLISEGSLIYQNGLKKCKCKFKFDDLSFFSKILPLRGRLRGSINANNGQINFEANSSKISYKDCVFYGVALKKNSAQEEVKAKNVKYSGMIFKDFSFSKINNKFSIISKLNDTTNVQAQGHIDGDNVRLTAKAHDQKNTLQISECFLNQVLHTCRVKAKLSNAKSQGDLDVNVTQNRVKVRINDLSLETLGILLDKKIPQCVVVQGRADLSLQNQIFIGASEFKMRGLVSDSNVIQLSVDNNLRGLTIHGVIKGKTDNVVLDAYYPVFIKHDWNMVQFFDKKLRLSLQGKAHLENLFNLPDGCKLEGLIDSELKIEGTLRSPVVLGYVKYTNALIAIDDILLKKGQIHLIGTQNKLLVKNAVFTDSFGNIARISGDGRILFSSIIPNINANLALSFQNFRLFDTDELKINITGDGRMSGHLNDMNISGNVTIPFCKLNYLGENIGHEYSGITIENDPYLNNHKQEEKSFFTYDVNMKCPRVDVKGDIYSLEFHGDLHLGTFNRSSTLNGQINLRKGRLDLFGRRMIFHRGVVTFFDESPFSPKIDLTCYKNIGTMTAFLNISSHPGDGTEINLYSRPNYTQDVILSQMLFGKSTKELSVGEAAQLAHAVTSLNRKGYIFSILNTLQGTGLVDSISFSTRNNSTSLYQNTQSLNNNIDVSAGKYLNDKVFVSVNRKDEDTSFDVDISLNKNTSLKVNTLGEAGISWKYRY
ncbi:MAG: hypothetical protein E7015_03825 [Alphaproteobacteria bacterium]|nr:hypothetical protein [Alphaproteobacteria bacterium]